MNKELRYQNKKIFYRIIGKGKPVVLIHGFGEDSYVWQNQIAYLKDSFQLIVPDLPGSGKSEMIDDMSMEGMTEVINAILEVEKSGVPPRGGFRGLLLSVIAWVDIFYWLFWKNTGTMFRLSAFFIQQLMLTVKKKKQLAAKE